MSRLYGILIAICSLLKDLLGSYKLSVKGNIHSMKNTLYLQLLLCGLLLTDCTSLFLYWIKPSGSFQESKVPETPDYSKQESWAALPSIKDDSDEVPNSPEFKNLQDQAKADVFFVHPTTFIKGEGWNAEIGGNLIVYGISPLKLQASIFNESARIYAPRYRQAVLYSFVDETGSGEQAFSIARRDVLSAFEYYLKHYNKGRPFFIAGHSQGSMMLISVLKEYLDKGKVSNFVAAYLPGWSIRSSDFSNLKICRGPKDIGCYVSWNSKKWGSQLSDFALPAERYVGGICVNPVNWTLNSSETSKEFHKGGVGIGFSHVDRNYVRTKCQGEMLQVDLPSNPDYESRRGNKKNYHIADYGLFYLDVRTNIRERLEAYFSKKTKD
ncbi:PF11288 family protein [Leptospira inadai serovar Lyme str. 10]|uniref:PF11288 family protein n=2 Tax=Leptospira inadai serovar Lyme TaxID=293084 RepID=V6I0D1_9LEPT|nr:DUF3089 domain-containing protein [Leptospira inadai]EQA38729.1 PF11288 family protein [Leptospira inadai serovar Lyme str. 10]